MLHRIIGRSGSGKTEYMLSRLGEAIHKERRCYLIVPEQQSVAYEAMLCDRFGDKVNLFCEVLNFERLPNRIAREFGGLAINNIDKGGACALLSLIAESLRPRLGEYSAVATDTDFAITLFGLISKMKMAMITPEKLLSSLENPSVSENARLVSKINDIALIYGEYEKYFGEELFDPRDALTRLAEQLPQTPFFKGTQVFIDGYYTFTEQEYEIIKNIISQSDEAYISFTCEDKREFFEENRKCAARIGKIAKGNFDDYLTNEPNRANSKSLSLIEANIWKQNADKLSGEIDDVRLISAKNRFDEVEAAAAQILEFVRSGNRFDDITILTNNTDKYASIIDSVFSRAGIPCYTSARESLVTKPLFGFLFASLSVVIEDFSLRSVKNYIKSGYTDLTSAESNALLNYATSWNLQGKSWYSENDWTLDPSGYKEGEMSARSQKQLELANRARTKIVEPLTALKETLKSKDLTVSKAVRALYTHLISMSADETLRAHAERLLNEGKREDSEREIQLWKHIINLFNQLDKLCGEWSIAPKRLQGLMRLMCDCYSLGAIPPSADSVTFGSASLIRAGGSKMVIVLGCCDGEFPQSPSKGGLFNSSEAVALEDADLVLADTVRKQLNTARFFVYAALSAPTHRLIMLCPRAELAGGELRPSMAWHSVKNMLPDITETDFKEVDLLYSADAVAANFALLSDGVLKDDIEKELKKSGVSFLKTLPEITTKESHVDYKEESLKLSPSSFETYAQCPFSFFGKYFLNLQPKMHNEFNVTNVGLFIHNLLDTFMKNHVKDGVFLPPAADKRKGILTEYAHQYIHDYIGDEAFADKQFMHILGNMIKTVDVVVENIIKEFSKSKFVPTAFEVGIGNKKDDIIPAIKYDVNGKTVYLRGKIDRVDTYKTDEATYVRVVDYKTYVKSLSKELISQGIDTQLFHYLFAYCEHTGGKPAGALYYKATLPNVSIIGTESEEEIKEMQDKKLIRNGLILDNEDIIYAMSSDLSTVPAYHNKKENRIKSKSDSLRTAEEFDELSQSLKEQVKSLAGEVICGNMDIAPNSFDGKVDPCKYCKLGEFCRSKKNKEDDDESNTTAD